MDCNLIFRKAIHFSRVEPVVKEQIIAIMKFRFGSLPVKYLGLPLISTRLTKEHCQDLITRIATIVQNWIIKTLSYAGRL